MSTYRFDGDSLLADALDHPDAREILVRALPGVMSSPLLHQLKRMPLKTIVVGPLSRLSVEQADGVWTALAAVTAEAPPERVEAPAIDPDPDYEAGDVARGSARILSAPSSAGVWETWEVVLEGPSHGNPFVDVEFGVVATGPDGTRVRLGGFFDGGDRWVVRLLPELTGPWSVTTFSTARSLDGISVTVDVVAGPAHGPVRVDGFHFRHADGLRHVPLGTTAYAWTHQPAELQEHTLQTLADSAFTKMRMAVFPKAYLFNENEPELFPFVRDGGGDWDFTRFDPAFFRHLEGRIRELGSLGIEADVILFHAYDRWGFSDMGRAADDRYVRYLVRRLAALPNVWWSMANEYDLLFGKTEEDWERMAAIVTAEDPYGHLNSIHNCLAFYDYSRPWITHASVQRLDVYRTAENIDGWRGDWGKPVVIDECAYEGDIDQGWGNITGEEMTRRFWEGAVRGGYVGHGETYLNDREELWWSKGGELVGSSPARIAFLRRIIAESPTGVLDPLPSDWDTPWGGVADEYVIGYFGFNRPSYRDLVLDPGIEWLIDVVDTWNMTVDRLPGTHRGSVRVPLPARQYMAIRLVAVAVAVAVADAVDGEVAVEGAPASSR